MRTMIVFTLLAAVLYASNQYGCPCQETRKPGKDKKIVACNFDGSCDCGCSDDQQYLLCRHASV